ncbi:hypothetical protein PAPYR_2235 [Paratrimastix pyriformis]|uniref:G-protein coupled receptors family 2 profile 2 domain-containing protein n=1 Tax=Paratrimastix pyriformis TaxID=342808 RepID=A0ABQ8UQV0_9EUKA|nr:hypothetical protein PAPYR_2235 [Paratrimastix pyriformis]
MVWKYKGNGTQGVQCNSGGLSNLCGVTYPSSEPVVQSLSLAHVSSGMSTLSPTTLLVADILVKISGSLSILGNLSIILSYAFFSPLRCFANRLILVLSLMDIFSCCGFIASRAFLEPLNIPMCIVQAVLIHYFTLAQILLSGFIAIVLYAVSKGYFIIAKLEKWAYCFALVVPLAIVITLGVLGGYGDAGTWCWISNDANAFRLYMLYIPLWIVFWVSVVLLLLVTRKFQHFDFTKLTESEKVELHAQRKRRLYLLAFFFVWLFPSLFNPTGIVVALTLLHSATNSLGGFINALIFMRGSLVRHHWRLWCRRCCCCCPRRPDALAGTIPEGEADLAESVLPSMQLKAVVGAAPGSVVTMAQRPTPIGDMTSGSVPSRPPADAVLPRGYPPPPRT